MGDGRGGQGCESRCSDSRTGRLSKPEAVLDRIVEVASERSAFFSTQTT
jgi:hypothetical protein